MKHTKIVCTIGPASESKATLKKMIEGGMNVARLNFSHGDYNSLSALLQNVRDAAEETKAVVAVLQDLQGPRIRTGAIPEPGVEVKRGDKVVLVSQGEFETYSKEGSIPVPIQFEELHEYVKEGAVIAIQDGTIELKVEHVKEKRIFCVVKEGGVVRSHKGMNAPGSNIDIPILTAKDKQDIEWGVSNAVDYIALSFVREAGDIHQTRKLLPENTAIKLIAKIERAEAVENFDDILAAADGIMVARGDLGVEVGQEEVPLLQKEFIAKCVKVGKPVIVATQMMESMVQNPRPTRAEVSDVANAIIDHTDAVMLSAESATGKYPVKVVRTMTKIARKIEKSALVDVPAEWFADVDEEEQKKPTRGIAQAAVELAQANRARNIIVLTHDGQIVSYMSQMRPHANIIAATDNMTVHRQLALLWGVRSLHIVWPRTKQEFFTQIRDKLLKRRYASIGDTVVIVYAEEGGEEGAVPETMLI